MNVLFVSSWYPTAENPNFGIFIKEHAKAIHSTENEIIVLATLVQRSDSFFKLKITDSVDETGMRIVQIVISSRYKDLLHHLVPLQNQIAYSVYKKRIFPTFSVDIVHSNVVFPAGMIGDYISRKICKPHIITEHWSKIAGILQKPFLSGLTKDAYRNAAKILPVSEFLKKNMMNLMPFLNEEKIQVIPNVVNLETFTYKQKTQNKQELNFCAIATWATKKVPDKKPELFIEALAEFQRTSDKKIVLTMIGGGDRVNELKQLCKDKSLKNNFLGYQNKEQIAAHLQKSDFFIHASNIETFGVVIVEALMTGTPVICSGVGALPELIDNSNGVLCENSLESWIAGIKTAIDTSYNFEHISAHTGNRYSLKTIGNQLNDIYKTVL